MRRDPVQCKYFNTPRGCLKGNSCTFAHTTIGTGNTNQWSREQKGQFYPDVPVNALTQANINLTNSYLDKKWFFSLPEQVGQVFVDLFVEKPSWVFTCYQRDASSSTSHNLRENNLSGDNSPEEIRWATYREIPNGQDAVRTIISNISKEESKYRERQQTVLLNCVNLIRTEQQRRDNNNNSHNSHNNNSNNNSHNNNYYGNNNFGNRKNKNPQHRSNGGGGGGGSGGGGGGNKAKYQRFDSQMQM
eukprot:TRINITY_DN13134_c0_g1_i1.p1 TRINITY_DN13134_c0_g1~~TRINITY_DN13134_c0_g1_i1.p1  ORF type:complete len:246 (-),score=48.99 TRINITY_DN13134_c0_g1_i1:416-1153(-)